MKLFGQYLLLGNDCIRVLNSIIFKARRFARADSDFIIGRKRVVGLNRTGGPED